MAANNIIVVLGMHRSGTSVITRGLQVLGVDLGDKLIGGIVGNNEKGFWEDAEINDFNNSLLLKLDSAWDRLKAISIEALVGAEFLEEREQALVLLRGKLRSNSLFAFKDPRTAILLPFWQEVFSTLDLSASYLIAVRNPMEIAESLHRRDGISILKGMLLWVKYSMAALQATHGAKRIFVAYSAVMQNPLIQLKRISQAFELVDPELNQSELFEYVEEFLSPELRHNVSSFDELIAPEKIPPFVSELSQFLLQLTSDKYSFNSQKMNRVWQAIERHYADFVPMLNQLDQLEYGTFTRQPNNQLAVDILYSKASPALQEEFKVLSTFSHNSDAVYSDFKRFIYKWNLESIQQGNYSQIQDSCMIVSGWVASNTLETIHLATRQDGITRCYPMNIERPDVRQVMLSENPSLNMGLKCGFSYSMKSGSAFDIGFEIGGWMFWLYSGLMD